MTQCNGISVTWININNRKGTWVTLRLSVNIIDNEDIRLSHGL